MPRWFRIGFLATLTLVALLSFVGCGKRKPKSERAVNEKHAPIIMVSVPPYQTMVEQVGSDTVRAISVLSSDVDPHSWEPTYKDLSKFRRARIWFTIGEEFEPKLLAKLQEINPTIEVINLREILPSDMLLFEPGSRHPDNHFWLDPVADILQTNEIRAALTKLQPKFASLYETRFLSIRDRLSDLQLKIEAALAPFKEDILVTTHGAYTYFCNRYNLMQVVLEPCEGKEPKTKDMTRLFNTLETKKSSVLGIFLQPQHSNQAGETLAKNLELPTYMIDPYAGDYVTTMKLLTDAIQKHE